MLHEGSALSGGRAPKVLFYVQHLLGIGHLLRAARVAKALAANGFDVLVTMGGPSVPGLDMGAAALLALPPVKAGAAGFSALVHPDGTPFGADAQAGRAAILLDAFDRFAPDVLMTEAFPFGRRQMRFELLPLLARAKARASPPLIVASVRDILQRDRRPERIAETVGTLDRFFDLVIVHGDPRLASLEHSFPDAAQFASKVVYSGLVAPSVVSGDAADTVARYAVVVSVGGGAVGQPLLEAALRARPLTRLAEQPWLVLTGPNMSPAAAALVAGPQDGTVIVKTFVPDLVTVLARAHLSISQAGYNTVADVLVGRCRSVLVPYGRDGETEQGDRAALLSARGLAVSVTEEELTPERLAAAVDQAIVLPPVAHGLDLDGANTTARILRRKLQPQV